jgi:hypothetical protein
LDGHGPLDHEVDTPVTVTAPQFAVPNVTFTDELFVLVWDVGGTPDGGAPSALGGVVGDFHPPRWENGVLVVGHGKRVVTEDDGSFGVGGRILLSLDFRRPLFNREVTVGVPAVNLGPARLALTAEQASLPVDRRVGFDLRRG